MNKQFLLILLTLGWLYPVSSGAVVIDFNGGTAHLSTGIDVPISDVMTSPLYYSNVDYYIENGVKFDFLGGVGTVGRYYDSFAGHQLTDFNSVIHAHWGSVNSMVISMVDGSVFDLNYIDLTSNTTVGGGAATGTELSYITASGGYSELLPSSDWGIGHLSGGAPGDGIERLLLGSEFDAVSSVTFTSDNAFCFGLDNFYINEPAPPIPEPSVILLMGAGLIGLVCFAPRNRV